MGTGSPTPVNSVTVLQTSSCPGDCSQVDAGLKGPSLGHRVHHKHSAALACLRNHLFFPGPTHVGKDREYLHPSHPPRLLQMARSQRKATPFLHSDSLGAEGTSCELNAVSKAVSSPGALVSVTCCSDAPTYPGFSNKYSLAPWVVPALVLNATVVNKDEITHCQREDQCPNCFCVVICL